MNFLASAVVKLLTWLGTIFLIRKGAKDAVRADAAEKTVEDIAKATGPATDAELDGVRARYRRP